MQRTDAALGYDKNQLQRRPSVGNSDAFASDRAIEFLWGGHKWNWMATTGNNILDDFDNITTDLTVDFGAYAHNESGTDGSEMFFGARSGRNGQAGTLTFAARWGRTTGSSRSMSPRPRSSVAAKERTIPTTATNSTSLTFPSPINTGSDYTFPAWTPIVTWTLDCYEPIEDFDIYTPISAKPSVSPANTVIF